MRATLMPLVAVIVAIAAIPGASAREMPVSNSRSPSNTSPATGPKSETAATDAAQAAPATGSGDIVVTVQRRSNLQRAAVPVDVVSAQGLLENGSAVVVATDPARTYGVRGTVKF